MRIKNIQIFKVTLQTSNEDINDVRIELERKLSDWLDNISFITGKTEICKKVEIIKDNK